MVLNLMRLFGLGLPDTSDVISSLLYLSLCLLAVDLDLLSVLPGIDFVDLFGFALSAV